VDRRATPASNPGGTFGSADQDRCPPPLRSVGPVWGYVYDSQIVDVQVSSVMGKVILVGPGAALNTDGSKE
jgi:hypothetical protein